MIERKFVSEALRRVKASEYLKKELEKAGIVDVDIQRTTLATRITLTAQRPGLIIGRKGKNIQDLTATIEKELGIENPKIEVTDVSNPNLEPVLVAKEIANMLERGHKQKRVMQRAVSKIMSSGAIGVEIMLRGTWRKGLKAKHERAAKGYIKKAGDSTKFVKVGRAIAILKQGVIGITVKIVPPGVVFPDKIDIKKVIMKMKETENEKQEIKILEKAKEDEKNVSDKNEGIKTDEPTGTEGKAPTDTQ